MSSLVRQFNDFSAWRSAVGQALGQYEQWLKQQDLAHSGNQAILDRARERLRNEKLTVAFVAEFSRGKSELINAIFFAGYGQRILPSSAGRTTMCPTELLHDPSYPPSIQLLPIETRAEATAIADLKDKLSIWHHVRLELDSPEQMLKALSRVAETKRVPIDLARTYGLYDDEDPDQAGQRDSEGHIEISCWRHAIINFPHPLLQQGLVVIDTPGLNAIGTEAELTLNLIPNADAVLFILAADTGVTKTDIEVWRKHIGGAARHGRIVVLNKIDTMWDELRGPAEVENEIERQIQQCGRTLGLDNAQVLAVSAQKGLVAKIHDDPVLLQKSRLPHLEEALSNRLVPHRRRIVAEQLSRDTEQITKDIHGVLLARVRNISDQLFELNSVRGKNITSVERMLDRIGQEKEEFDLAMRQLVATRSVFTKLSNHIYSVLGLEALRKRITEARARMLDSRMSKSLRGAMGDFLATVRADLIDAEVKANEVFELMTTTYKRFANEQGMTLPPPQSLRLRAYFEELTAIEEQFKNEFGTFKMLTRNHDVLVHQFFETIARRVRDTFVKANRDLEAWLKSIMAPIEAQTRDHQRQLRKRLESIKRVHEASDELEARIAEVMQQQAEVDAIAAEHGALVAQIRAQIFALSIEGGERVAA